MPLVNTKDMFLDAYKNNYAVGAFNVDSIAMIQAVLLAAEKLKSPVIISLSKGSREFMHPGNIKEQILCVSKDITIPFAIHLDHGKSVELCKDCIDEGFTSVMIDASAYDFEENIRQTKEVVEYAHKHNVTVEGELAILTTKEDYPALIEEFVKRTNVDSLAISIGTGHGTTKFKKGEVPHLDFDILEEVSKRLPNFPCVLHGSSSILKKDIDIFNNYGGNIVNPIGIPEDLLRKAASMAICKINIGTDFRVAYVGALRKSLSIKNDRYEPRNFLLPAKEAAQQLVEYKLKNVFNSAFKVK
ncbi:MAG: ketose-bisphosphate aldolase [Bacilli bacterium]|nr:ketose-bisphosphate aldolase [Bacilli bacterium]